MQWPRSLLTSSTPWLASPHTISRTLATFYTHIKEVKLKPGEVKASYDIKALFISVPMNPSINIAKQKLQEDPTLSQRTNMSIPQVITLLEFCLKNTNLFFQGKYLEQFYGAAMGFPISPFIANLFMEEFKVNALSSSHNPPSMAKVCGRHLCHPGGKTQSTITTTHQLTIPTYTLHCRGTKPRRSPTLPGHFGFSRSKQHTSHHSLQKAYTNWPIHTLGQQPFHQNKK